jgi:hypothetical protein
MIAREEIAYVLWCSIPSRDDTDDHMRDIHEAADWLRRKAGETS